MAVRPLTALLLLGLVSCQRGPALVAPAQPSDPSRPRESGERSEADPTTRADGVAPGDRRIIDGGVAAMDSGDFEKARLVFAGLLDRYPDSAEIHSLHEKAVAGLTGRQAKASALDPLRMPPTAFRRQTIRDAAIQQRARPPELIEVVKQRNEITDDERWFADNGLRLPLWEIPIERTGQAGNLPSGVPRTLGETPIIKAIQDEHHTIAMYAEDFSGGRIVVVLDQKGEVEGSFDFSAWARSPKDLPSDADFTDQRVRWALVREGILFVSTGHNTYAKSSGGLTGFITAVDVKSGEVLWRSDPLVANATDFVYEDGYIITGYGFTAEPDFMIVLDAKTGKTVSKTKVKSGPSYIFKIGQRLLVRTYDTNYVFELR